MPSYLLRLSRLLKRARTQRRSLKLLRTFDSPLRLLRKRVAAFDSFASDLTEGRLLRERLTHANNVQPPRHRRSVRGRRGTCTPNPACAQLCCLGMKCVSAGTSLTNRSQCETLLPGPVPKTCRGEGMVGISRGTSAFPCASASPQSERRMKGKTDELDVPVGRRRWGRRDGEKCRRVENCRGGDEKKRGLMEKWSGLLGELEEHQEIQRPLKCDHC